jgi:hypothetical protein
MPRSLDPGRGSSQISKGAPEINAFLARLPASESESNAAISALAETSFIPFPPDGQPGLPEAGAAISSDAATNLAYAAGGGGHSLSAQDLEAAGWNPGGKVTLDGATFTLPDFGTCTPTQEVHDNILADHQTIGAPPAPRRSMSGDSSDPSNSSDPSHSSDSRSAL